MLICVELIEVCMCAKHGERVFAYLFTIMLGEFRLETCNGFVNMIATLGRSGGHTAALS